MVQKGQKNSGKGKSVVTWSDLERLADEVCHQLHCHGSVKQEEVPGREGNGQRCRGGREFGMCYGGEIMRNLPDHLPGEWWKTHGC